MGSDRTEPPHEGATSWDSVATLDGDRTFSNGLNPLPAGSKRDDPQLVWTRKVAPAPSPAGSNAATAWAPGVAEAGTVNETENIPAAFVVAVATVLLSKVTVTESPAGYPAPLAWSTVVGGPTVGASVNVGPAAPAVAGTTTEAISASPAPTTAKGAIFLRPERIIL